MAFERFLFANPFLLFELHIFHQLRVIKCRLSKEVNLLILELLRLALQIIGNLIVRHPIFYVLFPVVIIHNFVVFFEFQPSSCQYFLHDSINWPFHRLRIDALDGLWSKEFNACEILHNCTGHKSTYPIGSAILVGQVLHFLRVLVQHQRLTDLHFDYRQEQKYLRRGLYQFLIRSSGCMNIQVTNNSKIIETKHYEKFIAQKEQQDNAKTGDVAKLLALKRNLTVKPAQLQLMSLCKSNQIMRKLVLQAKQICLSGEDTEMVISQLACLLEKY